MCHPKKKRERKRHCNKQNWSDEGSKATLKHVLRSSISTLPNSPSACPTSPGVATIRDLLRCSTALNPLTFSPGSHGRTQAKALAGKKRSPMKRLCKREVSRRGRKGPPTPICSDQGGVAPNQRLSYSQAHSSLTVTAPRRSATSPLMCLCPTGDKLHKILLVCDYYVKPEPLMGFCHLEVKLQRRFVSRRVM